MLVQIFGGNPIRFFLLKMSRGLLGSLKMTWGGHLWIIFSALFSTDSTGRMDLCLAHLEVRVSS